VRNRFDDRPARLPKLLQRVSDGLAAEGRPLPEPPDPDDQDLDDEFWRRVRDQLTADERRWLWPG
jgi:hypothetical protein